MKKLKLILGSAGVQTPDAVTLDINPDNHPDVVHDLNHTPWPFEDNQFQEVVCHHVLEHLTQLNSVMDELHRICRTDGKIYIEVPHHSSWMAHTPEHVLQFNPYSLDGYLADGENRWMKRKLTFRLIQREITFHKAFRRYFLHRLFNKYSMLYERFWTYIFPAEHLKWVLTPNK